MKDARWNDVVESLKIAVQSSQRRVPMVALKNRPAIAAEVVTDPSVMDGVPVVRETRIPAATILAYLRGGHSHRDIFEDYPTLPIDGIEGVIQWAEATYGPDWRGMPDGAGPSR
jgi:uncharacterized protein (DUF433 family)